MQSSGLELTWDQEDADRIRATRRHFTKDDLENMDFSAYLASSASESEDETSTNPASIREKYKTLLLENNRSNEETGEDMEITFTSGLTDSRSLLDEDRLNRKLEGSKDPDNHLISDKRNDSKKARQRRVQSEFPISNDGQLSDISKYSKIPGSRSANIASKDSEYRSVTEFIGKKTTQKRKISSELTDREESLNTKQHADLQLLMLDERMPFPPVDKHNILMRRDDKLLYTKELMDLSQRSANDTFEVNVTDPRFSALYESSEYAIDPTNPQ